MDKIIKVNFEEGWKTQFDNSLTQEDFGLSLQIEGITLPDGNVEVHFSLAEHIGEAPVFIGTVKDNVITVEIPDFILAKENVNNSSYKAYAWIYVTDGESGRTIRKIVFTINARPKSTTNVPEDKKDQFLEEVRQVMRETKEIAQSVRDDADAGKFGGGTNLTVDTKLSEESKNAVENRVIAKEVNGLKQKDESLDKEVIALKERNTELKETIEKLQIKSTTSPSPFHHITDSANMKVLDFGMEGKTEQNTVAGNQLFDIDSVEVVGTRTCTYEINNGNIVIYPTGEDSHPSVTIKCPMNVVGGKYIGVRIEGKNIGSDTVPSFQMIHPKQYSATANSSFCIRLTDDMEYIKFLLAANVNASSTVFSNIMVTSSDTSHTPSEYEPYVGGTPSPNPEYQQEVKNAGVYNEESGKYEIGCSVSQVDNCIDNKYLVDSNSVNGLTAKVLDDGGIQIVGTFTSETSLTCWRQDKQNLICLKPADSVYTYQVFDENGNKSNVDSAIYIGGWGETRNGASMTRAMKDYGAHIGYVKFTIKSQADVKTYYPTMTASSPDKYVKNTDQIFTLTSPVPLTKWDKLVKRDGVWGWSIQSKEYNLSGDEMNLAVAGYTGELVRFNFSDASAVPNTECFCNLYQYSVGYGAKNTCGYWFGNVMTVYQPAETLVEYGHDSTYWGSINAFKAFIKDKGGIQICVDMQEEQSFHPLPDEEQTLLNNLETYYGVTNVYNEQGCPMWLEYVNDTKLYVDKRLLEIQQAMI